MPFRGSKIRKKNLNQWLQKQPQKRFHFILGEQSYSELSEILTAYSDSSLTLLPGRFKNSLTSPVTYKLHQLLCGLYGEQAHPFEQTLPDRSLSFFDRFLDHCIELAENDAL